MHDGKMLVVGHTHDTSFAALPGGHLEWGEDVHACLEREMIEELGIKPDIGRLLYIQTFIEALRNTQPVEFFFEIRNGSDYLDIQTIEKKERSHAHELAEIYWASPDEDVNILPTQIAHDFSDGTILAPEVRFISDL